MAKKKKVVKKKPADKKPVKKASGKVVVGKGNSNVDPNQAQLPGVEDDRVAVIEKVVKQIVDKKSQRSLLKEEVDELVERLLLLFKKHKLTQYSCYGKIVVVEPGADIVKIKKAKTQ